MQPNYTSVANGTTYHGVTVGSGYDCAVRRESDRTALVCLTDVRSKSEWLTEIEIDEDTDLERLAINTANAPSLSDGGWAADDSDEWDHYAERWNACVARN